MTGWYLGFGGGSNCTGPIRIVDSIHVRLVAQFSISLRKRVAFLNVACRTNDYRHFFVLCMLSA